MNSGQPSDYHHIIVGGGVYGCYLALKLVEIHPKTRVLLVEREKDLLLRASYNNQARIHNGYHYPRSLLTALRSRINFPRFAQEFSECVVKDFEKLYAIATHRSNVTAAQFYQFCQRIGAAIRPAPARYRKLFNPEFVEEVFLVEEYAFDAERLRALLKHRLVDSGVQTLLHTESVQVIPDGRLRLLVKDLQSGESRAIESQYIYNCTYSNLNALPARSGLAKINLRLEATEIALVQGTKLLENVGITVMDGPFFSVMPFPARRLFSLSHVSYTPHYEWTEIPSGEPFARHHPTFPLKSNAERMIRDASRYLPILSECSYVESLWEVKTILPQSDGNDSRPILFSRDPKVPEFISVLGGKIDNIFDLDEAVRNT